MKTEDLIATLAAQPAPAAGAGVEQRLMPALAAGLAGMVGLFLLVLGPRPGLMSLLGTQPLVLAKTLLPLLLGVLALALALRAARPGAPAGLAGRLVWLIPAVTAGLFVLAFVTTPAAQRLADFIGHSIPVCLPAIPLLSLPVLAGLLTALRRGAPTRPAACGALAGLAAAGFATALYSTFCIEDTPLFYGVWYSVGIGLATGLGALAGDRWLRW